MLQRTEAYYRHHYHTGVMKYFAPLYLASKSRARKELLESACIPFTILNQSANESYNKQLEPALVAQSIACTKMDHVLVPRNAYETTCFVLTADTICVDYEGKIHGKPLDHENAIRMLKLWRQGSTVITAFCLERKVWSDERWKTEERIVESVTSMIDISIPEVWIEEYLTHTDSQEYAGAMTVEGYGFQFVKSSTGSYSNILGLPLFQVREALTKLGFFIF
jgi:septum formation protein